MNFDILALHCLSINKCPKKQLHQAPWQQPSPRKKSKWYPI